MPWMLIVAAAGLYWWFSQHPMSAKNSKGKLVNVSGASDIGLLPTLILSSAGPVFRSQDVMNAVLAAGLDIAVVDVDTPDLPGVTNDPYAPVVNGQKVAVLTVTSPGGKIGPVLPPGTNQVWAVILGSQPKGSYSIQGLNVAGTFQADDL